MIKKSNSLYEKLSRIDYQTVSLLILLFIAVQPLYGIFMIAQDEVDLGAMFYGKSVVIRLAGYFGIAVAVCNSYCKSVEHGLSYLKKKLLSNIWNGFFLLFLIWAIITTFTAKNSYTAFFGFSYRYEGLVSYLGYAGIYLSGSMIRDEKKRNTVLDVAVAVSVILALVTLAWEKGTSDILLLERNGAMVEYSGTFINPNHYGYYLCVIMMLCVGRLAETNKIIPKILFALAFALNTTVLCYNDSFGPALAAAIGLIIVFVLHTIRSGIKKSWQYLVLMLIFAYLCATVNDKAVLISAKETWSDFQKLINDVLGKTVINTEVASIGNTGLMRLPAVFSLDVAEAKSSDVWYLGGGRYEFWKAGLQLWRENPIFGVGIDNSTYEMSFIVFEYDMIHNEFIQIMAELGTPGILFYLSAQGTFIVKNIISVRKIPGSAFAAIGAAGVYLISAFFGISIPFTESFLFLCLGICNGHHTDNMLNEMLPNNPDKLSYKPEK